uniref:Uncharacterized protein n=1 Tax=Arion vulgaris TaxID=1028688 RepID=A0A0B7B5S4_9EUPU
MERTRQIPVNKEGKKRSGVGCNLSKQEGNLIKRALSWNRHMKRKRRERRCTQRRDLEAEFIDMQNNKKELLEKIFKERQIWHELVNCLCCNRGTIERLPSFVFVPRNIDHSLVLI